MKRDDNSAATELLHAIARDCTPAPAPSAVQVLFAPMPSDMDMLSCCASVLSGAEQRHAESLLTQDLRQRFWMRRALRRYCGARALGGERPLTSVEFEVTEKGRPFLPAVPDCWFSFSACRLGLVGAWSWSHDVGVDIEDPTTPVELQELARHYFTPAEAHIVDAAGGVDRANVFFRLWTLKEAALKSIGEGMPFGLDAFAFTLTPSPRIAHAPESHGGPQSFQAYALENVDGCASLVVHDRG